jgi:MFS family permease
MQTTDLGDRSLPAARALTRHDYKTLSFAALGGALEFYDFIIFVFLAPVIGQLFFPPSIPDWLRQLQTFGIFAAGYFARPLGGIVMAHFGDLFGRKRVFTLSVMLMALPTLAIGVLPTYTSIGVVAPVLLLVMRVLQGAAVAGEVPGAWVFVSEHVPPRKVGLACGALTGGLTAGILVGALISAAVNTHYSAAQISEFAWRMPFLMGGVFGALAALLRRWLHETPVFMELQKRKSLAAEMPLRAVVRGHRAAVVMSMLLTWTLSAAIVVVILMTPTLLRKQHHVSAAGASVANSIATLCLMFGCTIAGVLCDRFGARRVIQVGSVALAACYLWLFSTVDTYPHALLPLYSISGLTVGVVGAIPFVMFHAFPAAVRFSGISFSYNVAYALFGGLTPIIVSLLLKNSTMAPAFYVATLCGVAFVVVTLAQDRRTLP